MRQEFQKPAWMNDWKVFLLFSLVSFAFAFGLRCMDFPKWNDPAFMINGEYIMGTHDAYFWLAGAKGVGSAVTNPMAGLIRALGFVTGAQYGNIAFWLPAVFAGFTGVVAFGWGMLILGPWAGVVTAFFATAIPSYYFRTRLSYYDTDIVTLLFPLLISLLLARWVSQGTKDSWFKKDPVEKKFLPTFWDYLLLIVSGCLVSYGKLWHGDIASFGILTAVISVFLILVAADSKNKSLLLCGVLIYSCAASFGVIGAVLAVLLTAAFCDKRLTEHRFAANPYILIAVISAVILSSGGGETLYNLVNSKFTAYLKPVADIAKTEAGPSYPGIAQSVIEAQNVNFDQLIDSTTLSPFLAWLSLFGALSMFVFCPRSIYLVPFGVLVFASLKFGGRFSMFGGVAIGSGLSFLVYFAASRFKTLKNRQWASIAGSVFFVGIFLSNLLPFYSPLPPTPIIDQYHAKALVETGRKISKDSTIWTWWDWGYAATYYAGCHTFADGGHHYGTVLFPLSLAYSTPSFAQTNQLIKYSALKDNNPASAWGKMSGLDVQKMINSFGVINYNFKPNKKQYIVATWESLKLAYWILFYGSWDVVSGNGIHPSSVIISNPFRVDFEKGTIDIEKQGAYKLSKIVMIDKSGAKSTDFSFNVGPILLYNREIQQGYLIDDLLYNSMLVQLLIANPASPSVAPFFKVVYEGFPNIRIFEVL